MWERVYKIGKIDIFHNEASGERCNLWEIEALTMKLLLINHARLSGRGPQINSHCFLMAFSPPTFLPKLTFSIDVSTFP